MKPEPKTDLVVTSRIEYAQYATYSQLCTYSSPLADNKNVKFTFDGETKQLKSVELINN